MKKKDFQYNFSCISINYYYYPFLWRDAHLRAGQCAISVFIFYCLQSFFVHLLDAAKGVYFLHGVLTFASSIGLSICSRSLSTCPFYNSFCVPLLVLTFSFHIMFVKLSFSLRIIYFSHSFSYLICYFLTFYFRSIYHKSSVLCRNS